MKNILTMPNVFQPMRITTILLWSLALFMSGCFHSPPAVDYSSLRLARVQGRVTLDGKPVAGASISFEDVRTQPPRISSGTTDDSGHYTMDYDSTQPGVLPGEKIIRIRGGALAEGEDDSGQADSRIPAKYNRDSELKRTIEPDGAHTFDFELTTTPPPSA